MLGYGQNHSVKGVRVAVDLNRRTGDGRDFGVQMDGGRCETLRKLFGNGRNAVLGNDHLAVGHGAPRKVRKRHPFAEGRIKRDACEQGPEYTLCFSRKVSLLQSERNRWVTPSIERSKSLDEVPKRQRKKRKPSTMPTERSVGKR